VFKKLFIVMLLVIGLPASLMAGWVILSNTSPGTVGTPAHAGAVSNGKPEGCTTVDLQVRARSKAETKILLADQQVVRGTYEADGGFGHVDILMRIESPQGDEIFVSPKKSNYDFVLAPRIGGEYTFVFDNRYSLVTPKAIGLYYCIAR
jgi:hypothetical protein